MDREKACLACTAAGLTAPQAAIMGALFVASTNALPTSLNVIAAFCPPHADSYVRATYALQDETRSTLVFRAKRSVSK